MVECQLVPLQVCRLGADRADTPFGLQFIGVHIGTIGKVPDAMAATPQTKPSPVKDENAEKRGFVGSKE